MQHAKRIVLADVVNCRVVDQKLLQSVEGARCDKEEESTELSYLLLQKQVD
jgi:hypothetical protein